MMGDYNTARLHTGRRLDKDGVKTALMVTAPMFLEETGLAARHTKCRSYPAVYEETKKLIAVKVGKW